MTRDDVMKRISDARARGAPVDLQGADLRRADLRDADLRDVDLRDADLRDACLRCASLRGADLRGACLRWADLLYADLYGADLRGADLDYSCWPLWCGTKDMTVDARIVAQLLAHVCALRCDDPAARAAQDAVRAFAQTSHRATDLGV